MERKNKNIKCLQSKKYFYKNKTLLSHVDSVLNRKMRRKVTLKLRIKLKHAILENTETKYFRVTKNAFSLSLFSNVY